LKITKLIIIFLYSLYNERLQMDYRSITTSHFKQLSLEIRQ